jgi:hypothetical protein
VGQAVAACGAGQQVARCRGGGGCGHAGTVAPAGAGIGFSGHRAPASQQTARGPDGWNGLCRPFNRSPYRS